MKIDVPFSILAGVLTILSTLGSGVVKKSGSNGLVNADSSALPYTSSIDNRLIEVLKPSNDIVYKRRISNVVYNII
jgi:hypothetical protein